MRPTIGLVRSSASLSRHGHIRPTALATVANPNTFTYRCSMSCTFTLPYANGTGRMSTKVPYWFVLDRGMDNTT